MADRRRIVTLSPGGRPILQLDLETGSAFQAIKDTFAYVPGAQNQQASREPGRYGGQVTVGEENDNGTVTWQALVRGATADIVTANIETLIDACNATGRDRKLEWRPDGSTYSGYFRVAGPIAWKPTYRWSQWQGAQSMVVEVSVPVRPLVLWDPMDIVDPMDVNALADYTFDALTSGSVTHAATILIGNGTLSTERRAVHTIRGYKHLEGQASLRTIPNATITGYKAGTVLRRSAADTYVEVYVDDNGTNSRLRIDKVIAGVRTNLATTNLGARISSTNGFWVRGRIEGQTVYAEHFTATTPTPMGTPTTSTSYTLTSPEQASLPAGFAGWSWVPQHVSAGLDEFSFHPFWWRNQTLPEALTGLDVIPGTAPALADVLVTAAGGTSPPAWALIGWGRTPSFSQTPPSIIESETWTTAGWLDTAGVGTARGDASSMVVTSGAGTFSLEVTISPDIEPDDFMDEKAEVEVWARVWVSSTLVNPRLRLSIASTLQDSNSIEYGATGKLLTKPTSGGVYRFVRLGTVTVDVDGPGRVIKVVGTVETGSTGTFGIDYLVQVLAGRRAVGMTGVPKAETAAFIPVTTEVTKRVRSDLRGQFYAGGGTLSETSPGLGGSLIHPSPGSNRWIVKLSSLAPDDPTVDNSSEQLAHQATVHVDVTPRSYLLRAA